MRRREFIALVGGAVVAYRTLVAQQPGKVSRVGFLRVGPPPPRFVEGFRQGLRELGYVEGKNITWR